MNADELTLAKVRDARKIDERVRLIESIENIGIRKAAARTQYDLLMRSPKFIEAYLGYKANGEAWVLSQSGLSTEGLAALGCLDRLKAIIG